MKEITISFLSNILIKYFRIFLNYYIICNNLINLHIDILFLQNDLVIKSKILSPSVL